MEGALATLQMRITERDIRSGKELLVIYIDVPNNDRVGCRSAACSRPSYLQVDIAIQAFAPSMFLELHDQAAAPGWPEGLRNLTSATDDYIIMNFKRVSIEVDYTITLPI